MTTMRERFYAKFGNHTVDAQGVGELTGHLRLDDLLAFAASEVALAMQPLPPAPELAEAEKWLRETVGRIVGMKRSHAYERHSGAIAAELDRLRAEVARLTCDARKLTGALFNLKSLTQIQHLLAEGKLYGRGDDADRLMRAAISAANVALADSDAEGRR